MAGPFYPAIKGTTSGTPGTGAFTPNAAANGFRAWSTVPTGWIGMVRFEDGSDWELAWSYWNGTTLSRASTQVYAISTGSILTLTSSATAALAVDGYEIQPHLGGAHSIFSIAQASTNAISCVGCPAQTNVGTAAAATIATTNYLTEQVREQYTSGTTANAQAGAAWTAVHCVYSTASGRGGAEFAARFGPSQLPTGPRLFVGLTATTFVANTGEPSALTASYAVFAKDSTDTNIQLLVNSNAGTGTKTDTGIALTANGWYEASIWFEPGGGTIYGLLIRVDTGAIWYGSTSTDIPANGALMFPQLIGGLNGTNTGTAIIMHVGAVAVRQGM